MTDIAQNAGFDPRDTYASEDARLAKINATLGAVRLDVSPLARIIAPMMVALDWFGAPRTLLANLPGETAALEMGDIAQMLAGQGFAMQTLDWAAWQGGLDTLPAGSILLSDSSARVYLGRLDGSDWWHDGRKVAAGVTPAASDSILVVRRQADHSPIDAPQVGWLKRLVLEARKEIGGMEPAPELSCGATDSGNLIVQCDNLHALEALLPRYAGQVKCIYIDPPYNTGNEGWVYNDNVNSPEIRRWLGEVVGKEGETLDRHDRWLCMMYPRLVLLRQFLREDRAIFVFIDDNEVATLGDATIVDG